MSPGAYAHSSPSTRQCTHIWNPSLPGHVHGCQGPSDGASPTWGTTGWGLPLCRSALLLKGGDKAKNQE